ncbi:eCIS core domain-containing protein [Sorangium sp. So ce1182]|uniref:eCIS core domain-containing protein n=1 Tax=Sorangium sp. So ce1182 TaxID=3133334 RepID=UPI003F5F81AE
MKVEPERKGDAPGSSTGAGSTAQTPAGLIVDDAAPDVGPAQMKTGAFLAALRPAVERAVDESLAASLWGPAMRPLAAPIVHQRFARYAGMDAASLERSICAEAPGAAGSGTARTYIDVIAAHLRARTAQELGDRAKEDEGRPVVAGVDPIEGARSLASSIAGIFLKAREGGPRNGGDPSVVRSRLGAGASLDGRVRGGLEAAWGRDFSAVRVHTGAAAASLADRFNARAFTVGDDIAFGQGEYRPGTLNGDALIAHEVAHVAQQAGACSSPGTAGAARGALEAEADAAAGDAVASIWGRVRRGVIPRLSSGLSLRRCSKEKPQGPTIALTEEELGKHIKEKMVALHHGQAVDKGVWYAENYQQAFPKEWKANETKYAKGYANPDYFFRDGYMSWTLKSRKSASQALRAWFAGLTIAECASTGVALQYSAILAAVGDERFDRQFGPTDEKMDLAVWSSGNKLRISQSTGGGTGRHHNPLHAFMKDATAGGAEGKRTGLVVGQLYYFKNHPDYPKKHPRGDWQGENAVYAGEINGEQRWSGFGALEKTERKMNEELVAAFNAEGTGSDPVLNMKQITYEELLQSGGGLLVREGQMLDAAKVKDIGK